MGPTIPSDSVQARKDGWDELHLSWSPLVLRPDRMAKQACTDRLGMHYHHSDCESKIIEPDFHHYCVLHPHSILLLLRRRHYHQPPPQLGWLVSLTSFGD